MSQYEPGKVEQKWQQRWEADGLYRAEVDWSRPKHYALTMLPYPSGDLHIGHWYAMTPADAHARYMRMRGYNVLFPMGFDAFGLPAENAAIQRGVHPWKWTYANIERMRCQLRSMGTMFDWDREVVSCQPDYYEWSQWFFKRFYEGDLAYRGEALVNWSETLQTVLANEQVIDGKDERTGQPVVQKLMSQWFFAITRYADELLEFDGIDWPEPIRKLQSNWIGRSVGARVRFPAETGDTIEVFTTRPDTLWGATFMVLAPEHPLVAAITSDEQRAEVEAYVAAAAGATEIERSAEGREKTGVFTGGFAVNPVSEERIPIWIADYVMLTYGTGAIMAVPAHDERDFEFARKFGLRVQPVIVPDGERLDGETMAEAYVGAGQMTNSGPFDGTPSPDAKGRDNPAIAAVIDWLVEQDLGREAVNYRLRDWLVSRQRYWGAPIPMLRRSDGGYETVRDEDLPVVLPEDVEFMPSGRSPLQSHEGFLRTQDSDGNPAERETDTMDTFMCSSWYQYRYLGPDYSKGPIDPEEAAYWLPVDVYTGGAEHATMHLLYTRFFTKAMRDLGIFEETAEVMRQHGRDPEGLFDEPMRVLRNQGQVLGEERRGDRLRVWGERAGEVLRATRIEVATGENDGTPADVEGELLRRTENVLIVESADGEEVRVEAGDATRVEIPGVEGANSVAQLKHHLEIQRMSKSKGNVVNPDDWVSRHGADAVRAYLMFGFDWEKGGPWDSSGIQGVVRWLDDVWALAAGGGSDEVDDEVETMVWRRVHQTIDTVQRGLENFRFNTAIAALMSLRNELRAAQRGGGVSRERWSEALRVMVRLMAPFTPHVAEELWERLGGEYSVHTQQWPEFDAEAAAEERMTLVILVNGKVRDRVEVPADVAEEDARRLGLASEGAQRHLDGAEPRRVIFIPARQGQEPKLNIVV